MSLHVHVAAVHGYIWKSTKSSTSEIYGIAGNFHRTNTSTVFAGLPRVRP